MDEQLPAVSESFETSWDEEQFTGRRLRRPVVPPLSRNWREINAARLNEAFEASGGQARLNVTMHNQFDKLAVRWLLRTQPQQVNHAHSGVVRVIHVPLGPNTALDPLSSSQTITIDGESTDGERADTALGGSRVSDALIAAPVVDPPDTRRAAGV